MAMYHSGGKRRRSEQYLDLVASKLSDKDWRESNENTRSVRAESNGQCVIWLETENYRPCYTVTLRNDWDGWTEDLHGEYWDGAWIFRLDPSSYPDPIRFGFAVDGSDMTNAAIKLTVQGNLTYFYSDTEIQFPPIRTRLRHGFDNLISSKTRLQQRLLCGSVDESKEYDVIIIGSGMGGGILASQLADRNIDTLLLEAGGLLFQTHIDSLPGHTFNFSTAKSFEVGHYVNRPNSDSNFLFGSQFTFGGRSVFWEGLIPRMDSWEMDYWPDSMKTYLSKKGYSRAERLLRKRTTLGTFQQTLIDALSQCFTDFDVQDLPRSRHQPNLGSNSRTLPSILQRSTGTFSTADLLLDSISASGEGNSGFLTVNLNHLALSVETDSRAAKAVIAHDMLGEKERRYRGKFIVLAAGSLESPRIAIASQLDDPNKLIGVGLTDHAAFEEPNPVLLDPNSPFAGDRYHAKILMRHHQGASHPYTIEVVINPHLWDLRHSNDRVLQSALGSMAGRTTVGLKFLFDSELENENEVRYQGSGKKLEVHVKPNLRGLPFQEEIKEVRRRILEFLQTDFDPHTTLSYHYQGTVHHAGGTLRASDDCTGVVDQNLKFESYDNLYCCDVSFFPRIPTANPSLTLAALAQRLAVHLRRRLRKTSSHGMP